MAQGYETAANTVRIGVNAIITIPIEWDNGSLDKPENALWARATVAFTESALIMTGNGNTYRREGVLEFDVHSPLGSGEGESLTVIDSLRAAAIDLTLADVRFQQAEVSPGVSEAGWWVVSVAIPFFFDDDIALGEGTPGTAVDEEAVRSALRTLANDIIPIQTQYDNSNFEPPEDDNWARFTILGSTQRRTSTRTYRSIGVAEIALFAPLGRGDGELLSFVDTVVSGFLPATHQGVTLRSPSVTSLGRSGPWWQINISCPYYAEH